MRRKLVQQGKGALTISLPKEWIKLNELAPGEEIEIDEEGNDLIIKAEPGKYFKEISVNLEEQTSETYRNIIASLYRGGYDKINVHFSSKRVIPGLQKVVDSLHGFEIFDIKKDSCIIKKLYDMEYPDIESYVKKMVYTVKEMHSILTEELNAKTFTSKSEIVELRNTVLKQRDLIMRIIRDKKLFGNDYFPYYNIVISLWGIARNYFHLYLNLDQKTNVSKEEKVIFEKIGHHFNLSFEKTRNVGVAEMIERNKRYSLLRKTIFNSLKGKKGSLVSSISLNVLFSVQFADSSIYLLGVERKIKPF